MSLFGFYVVALAVSFPLQFTTAREPSIAPGVLATKIDSAVECDNQATRILQSSGAINEYLAGTDPKDALDDFHVHGWRWHTLSLSRESRRLSDLARRTTTANIDRLKKASEYVVGFNLKGLHKIEADLFFPWMKEKLTSIDSWDASKEFDSVMDLLKEINDEGMTVFVITHEEEVAEQTKRIVRLKDGVIISDTADASLGANAKAI